MIEIDRAAPVIFDMPAECGEDHSYVTPWNFHTIHIAFDETQHRARKEKETDQMLVNTAG